MPTTTLTARFPGTRLTALLAAATLVVGYAVAAGTGSRPLGGVVLLLGLAGCAMSWRRAAGLRAAMVLSGVFLALFVVSHLLARLVGAWPSVLLVAAGMYAAAGWLPRRSAGMAEGQQRVVTRS